MDFPTSLEFLLINMRELRRARGLTQKQLADILGETNTTISNWEKGITTPAIIDLMKLSMYYGITMDALVCKDMVAPAHRNTPNTYVTREDLEQAVAAAVEKAMRQQPVAGQKGPRTKKAG